MSLRSEGMSKKWAQGNLNLEKAFDVNEILMAQLRNVRTQLIIDIIVYNVGGEKIANLVKKTSTWLYNEPYLKEEKKDAEDLLVVMYGWFHSWSTPEKGKRMNQNLES